MAFNSVTRSKSIPVLAKIRLVTHWLRPHTQWRAQQEHHQTARTALLPLGTSREYFTTVSPDVHTRYNPVRGQVCRGFFFSLKKKDSVSTCVF